MTWWRLYAPHLAVGIASAALLLTIASWAIIALVCAAVVVLTLVLALSIWATNRIMGWQERRRKSP